jgi:hypothetical protein
VRRNYARRHSQTRMMIFTEGIEHRTDLPTADLDQENLLSSDLVGGMICVMALDLRYSR